MAGSRWAPIGLRILAVVAAFGMGFGARQLLFDLAPDVQSPAPAGAVTVRVRDAANAAETRVALNEYLFDSAHLPSARPRLNTDGTYTVGLEHSLTSTVRLIRPVNPNGRLTLYHAGHSAFGATDQPMVDALLAAGDTVLVFEMPFVGVNATEVRMEGPNGPFAVSRHDHLAYLADRTDGSPIRFFVEPVVVMLNELAGEYETVAMVGLSGGAWTTTLAAAVDARIARSYPVAGTVPMTVRFAQSDSWGDWEQSEPGLYAIAGYEDLYVLGALERRQLQVVNEHDPCCFGGDHRAIYVEQVKGALRSAGGGSFDVFLDTQNQEHRIGPAAIERIMADLQAGN